MTAIPSPRTMPAFSRGVPRPIRISRNYGYGLAAITAFVLCLELFVGLDIQFAGVSLLSAPFMAAAAALGVNGLTQPLVIGPFSTFKLGDTLDKYAFVHTRYGVLAPDHIQLYEIDGEQRIRRFDYLTDDTMTELDMGEITVWRYDGMGQMAIAVIVRRPAFKSYSLTCTSRQNAT